MKNKLLWISVGIVILVTTLVVAGDFQIEYGGDKIFTVATTGQVNASGYILENNVFLNDTYLALAGGTLTGNLTVSGGSYFVGDGSFLTGITLSGNKTTIAYQNITNLPTCDTGERLTFDGSTLTCAAPTANSMNIAGENITSGTIDFARLPSLTNTHTLDYHNITGFPTCSAGQHLYFDGTDMTCTADTGADLTNVARYNETVTWAETQHFDKGLNVTGNITFESDGDGIQRTPGGTQLSIDSSGNVIIRLA